MEIALVINSLATYVLMGFLLVSRDKAEKQRIQDITKAILARNIESYVETLPEDDTAKMELPVEDELEDVYSVDENILLKHLQEINGNNKN